MRIDALRDEVWRRLYYGGGWKRWKPDWPRLTCKRLACAIGDLSVSQAQELVARLDKAGEEVTA